jgi:hypothetical protein
MAVPQGDAQDYVGGIDLRTVVLALDGLELSIIERFGIDAFKQTIHGTYNVSMLERVFTPICFAAILTGKDPRSFGYTQNYLTKAYERGYPFWMKPFSWVRRNLFGWVKSFGVRDDLAKAGVFDLTKVHRNLDDEMRENTIFHGLKSEGYRVNPVGIPSYNEEFFDSHAQFPNYIGKDLFLRREYITSILDSVKETWLSTISEIDDYDLTFIYSPLPDVAHHLIAHEEELGLLKEVYDSLCRLPLLFELKNIALLILSDHGYEHRFREDGKDIEGDHHPFGFWSLNTSTEVRPTTVFDFHKLLHELVTT